MTLDELFSLPDGIYEAYLEDLRDVYSYGVVIRSNVTFKTGYTYEKWITIKLFNADRVTDAVNISKSDEGYVLFSTEAVSGLGISSNNEPTWFEYFKIKE
jgi:hypothetical protein